MAEEPLNARRTVCLALLLHRRATMRGDPLPKPGVDHNCVPHTDTDAQEDCPWPYQKRAGVLSLLPAGWSTRCRAYAPAKGVHLLYTMPLDPIQIIHQDAAKPDTQENPPPPQVFGGPRRWDNGESFKIQTIYSAKSKGGVIHYYVRWAGWDHTYQSWVKASDLQDPSLRREFLEDMGKNGVVAHLLEALRESCFTSLRGKKAAEFQITINLPAASERTHAHALLGYVSHPPSCHGKPGLAAERTEHRGRTTLKLTLGSLDDVAWAMSWQLVREKGAFGSLIYKKGGAADTQLLFGAPPLVFKCGNFAPRELRVAPHARLPAAWQVCRAHAAQRRHLRVGTTRHDRHLRPARSKRPHRRPLGPGGRRERDPCAADRQAREEHPALAQGAGRAAPPHAGLR